MTKTALYGKEIKKARQITDALKKPIDARILSMVAILNCLGFPTSGSCEGHLDWGCFGKPWVTIKPEGNLDRQERTKQLRQLKAKLQQLIDSFYKKKASRYERIDKNNVICIEDYGNNHWVRLIVQKPLVAKLRNSDDFRLSRLGRFIEKFYPWNKKTLQKNQEVMKDFEKFLHEEFLGDEYQTCDT